MKADVFGKLFSTNKTLALSLVGITGDVFKTQPLFAATLLVLTAVRGVIPASQLWVGKLIIDSVVQGIGSGEEGFMATIQYLVSLLGIQVASNVVSLGINVIQTLLGETVSHSTNLTVMQKAVSLDLSFYENPEFYNQLARARQESSHRPVTIVAQVIQLIENSVITASMLFVALRLGWLPAALLLVATAPQLLVQARYGGRRYSLRYTQTARSRELSYIFSVLTSVAHFKEVKLLNIGQYLLDAYKRKFETMYRENRAFVVERSLLGFASSFLGSACYVGFYAYVIHLTINRHITLGGLSLYAGVFLQTQTQLRGIVGNLVDLYENGLFLTDLSAFLKVEPTIVRPANPITRVPSVWNSIEFRHVSFRYPESEHFAVRDLSFEIDRNESVALVGDNGAGKTTIVKLLSRLHDPTSGEIRLDGVDIRNFDPAAYQSAIAVVFQDFARFYLTVKENIGFGRLEDLENDAKIRAAAARSRADYVVDRLPKRYDSILGRLFEDGTEISVGEWQKVAIARAFMRDGPLLILDEPTASLDAETEHEIFCRFRELTRDRISILISHRFSTVTMADRILVVDGGQLIEEGTHDQLLRLGGKYARMFDSQAQRYLVGRLWSS